MFEETDLLIECDFIDRRVDEVEGIDDCAPGWWRRYSSDEPRFAELFDIGWQLVKVFGGENDGDVVISPMGQGVAEQL